MLIRSEITLIGVEESMALQLTSLNMWRREESKKKKQHVPCTTWYMYLGCTPHPPRMNIMKKPPFPYQSVLF